MKFSIILAAALIAIATSCGDRNREYRDDDYDDYEGEYAYDEYDEDAPAEPWANSQQNRAPREARNSERRGFFSKRTKVHSFRDPKTGIVVKNYNYPANWNVISRANYDLSAQLPNFLIQIEGPKGLKAFNTPIKYHVIYSDPNLQAYLPESVRRMYRPEAGVQQLSREEVDRRMKNSGFRFVQTRPTREYETYVRQKLSENGNGNQRLEMYSTQWTNDQGMSGIATVTKLALDVPLAGNTYSTVWLYGIDYTFAEDGHIDAAQDQIVKTVINSTETAEWKQYVQAVQLQQQRQNQERSRQSALAHQNRMNARWAAFNAHQERMAGVSASMDANHASFMNRNFGSGSSTGQRDFVNMIHGEETVYNPMNGKSYQVQHGAKQYWMDSDGNLIQNNDLFYTPNGDINLNNREWAKVRSDY